MTQKTKFFTYLACATVVVVIAGIATTYLFSESKQSFGDVKNPEQIAAFSKSYADKYDCFFEEDSVFNHHEQQQRIKQYSCSFGKLRLNYYFIQLPREGFYFESRYFDECEGDEVASTEALLRDLEHYGLIPSERKKILADLSRAYKTTFKYEHCDYSLSAIYKEPPKRKECFVRLQVGDFVVLATDISSGRVLVANVENEKVALGDNQLCSA